MERQVKQLVRLVDDLLDVSRISRGKIELRRRQVELASVVQQAVEAARPLCESMSHELVVTLPSQSMLLNADPTRLAQVIDNLLSNACKFTDNGGRISLTVEREDTHVVIRVRDTGIGIAADQLPRIFGIFEQIDTSLERTRGGLGIGLALAKTLVEMHGGTLHVHSAGLGHGSEFVARLPMLTETAKPPLEPKQQPPDTGSAAPDSRSRRQSGLSRVPDCAVEVERPSRRSTAFDGIEAIEAAATFRPDVVLLDIGLPKLNGYETARRIREQPWSNGMVLVAVTGWGQEEDRQKTREAGFDAHLVKPIDFAALTKLLAAAGTSAATEGSIS